MKRIHRSSLEKAALWYAKHGFPVFPCVPKEKKPLTPNGFKDASTNIKKVRRWWQVSPNANIGIPTGEKSNLLVLDVDSRNGGNESLDSMIEKHGKLPLTAEQSTSEEGKHLVFRHVHGVKGKAFVKGIDLKAEGGYVIVAPSIHSCGTRYRWNAPGRKALLNLAEIPPKVLKSVQGKEESREQKTVFGAEILSEGRRNDGLFQLALSLRQSQRLSQEAITAALLTENGSRCSPPLETKEVRAIARSASSYSPENNSNSKQAQSSTATQLIAIARSVKLFHTPAGEAFAEIPVKGHREIWRLKDVEVRRWLAKQFYNLYRQAPSSSAISDALSVLEGKAQFAGMEREVFVRMARKDDAIYLDLANEKWEVVKITADGWKIKSNSSIRFRRPRGLQPLPTPERGGNLNLLYDLINVRKQDRILIAAWLIGTFQHGSSFPVLVLQGEQGSAKSTTARLLRQLIDPNKSPLRSQPKDNRDLMIGAQNGLIAAFDNVSYLPPHLSDALCSLATGAGFSARQLYSDDGEVLFSATRPILLNGIDGVVVRGDLLDRSLVVELPAIVRDARRAEKEVWSAFHSVHPQILGCLLDSVGSALGSDKQSPSNLPRMADFAIWADKAEMSLGFKEGKMLKALHQNQTDARRVPLEASPIVAPLRSMLREGYFKGTATELLDKLTTKATRGADRTPKHWPSNAQTLSVALNRLRPNLRADGIIVDFKKTKGTRSKRIITLKAKKPEDS